ncbi:hypothetical protein GCM10025791_48250 [Halioxenophilus aromaticivorans]|uniref:Tannase/feruloyl esterase family alpha/beta hydrolase n=1 Tax=Halioxenophilus aromaticivorans TaxID=1306992 RepID=A0AAV3UA29_9ALTE
MVSVSVCSLNILGCNDNTATAGQLPTAKPGKASCEAWLGSHQDYTGFGKVEVTSATYIDNRGALPEKDQASVTSDKFKPFCQLEAYFEKRTGADGKPYAIGLGLALPDDWNGRFYFQGGGALNGLVRSPIGDRASGELPALYRGFAVASTDSGHQSDSIFNHDFFADQQALLNFYSQAIYKSTLQAQGFITSYYQSEPQHRYFVGCSTGGREAMTMSQRYPTLFDGIIAGAPAMRTNLSELADLYMAKALRGNNSTAPFSAAQQTAITDALLEQCDGLDGLVDNLIMAVDHCEFKPDVLLCADNSDQNTCLTPEQISALQTAFAGPRTSQGDQVYPGFYFDTGISASGEGGVPGILQAMAGPLGKPRQNLPFDLNREIEFAEAFPLAPGNATLINLSTFANSGGKLMFYHGVSDPWFSAKDTLNYFRTL